MEAFPGFTIETKDDDSESGRKLRLKHAFEDGMAGKQDEHRDR